MTSKRNNKTISSIPTEDFLTFDDENQEATIEDLQDMVGDAQSDNSDILPESLEDPENPTAFGIRATVSPKTADFLNRTVATTLLSKGDVIDAAIIFLNDMPKKELAALFAKLIMVRAQERVELLMSNMQGE